MSSIQGEINELTDKLDKLCEDNNLELTVQCTDYPITFTVRQDQITFDSSEETPMVQFVFGFDPYVINSGDLKISLEDMQKIQSLVKKLHYLYLQDWFYTKNFRYDSMVTYIYETTVGDICLISKGYRP